ncbi:hypothetical protein [Kitasatospora sp. NPDC097643]|uniref:hypothetical protein n=1 Tax=Kitasatospora sp. NPDC097643 TaxID=3157230 RepID=UPI00332B381B
MTAPFSSPGTPETPDTPETPEPTGTPGTAGASGDGTGHPSVDELADLAEGLVESADAAAALHRHLDGCAECRATVDALGEVRALLGAVETPPMPADVAARLDAALAAAAASTEADHAETDHVEAPERPQEAPAPARRTSGPTAPPRAATAPAAPPARPAGATGPGRSRPRRRRLALLLGAATALAAIALGGSLVLRDTGPSTSGTTAVSAGAPVAGSPKTARTEHATGAGTVYRDDQLAAQVQQLLARATATAPGLLPTGPVKPSGAAPDDGRSELPTLASPTGCPAPAAGTPLAVDHGSYAGSPVEVLVYPTPGRPGFVDVYLRSPDCGQVLERTVPAH